MVKQYITFSTDVYCLKFFIYTYITTFEEPSSASLLSLLPLYNIHIIYIYVYIHSNTLIHIPSRAIWCWFCKLISSDAKSRRHIFDHNSKTVTDLFLKFRLRIAYTDIFNYQKRHFQFRRRFMAFFIKKPPQYFSRVIHQLQN